MFDNGMEKCGEVVRRGKTLSKPNPKPARMGHPTEKDKVKIVVWR